MDKSTRGLPPRFEEVAVRVMYFMTTIDSYVPIAGTMAWLTTAAWFGTLNWSPWLAVSFILTCTAFRRADYYPTFAAVLPVWATTLVLSGGVASMHLVAL